MLHPDWIPSSELHNSSINIFQTPTLYTRVSSSHYQSMTIKAEIQFFQEVLVGIKLIHPMVHHLLNPVLEDKKKENVRQGT